MDDECLNSRIRETPPNQANERAVVELHLYLPAHACVGHVIMVYNKQRGKPVIFFQASMIQVVIFYALDHGRTCAPILFDHAVIQAKGHNDNVSVK
jgi:hypothetical protein